MKAIFMSFQAGKQPVYWHKQIWTKFEEQFRPGEPFFCENPAGFQEKTARYGRNWARS
jgi:hypothetical protein